MVKSIVIMDKYNIGINNNKVLLESDKNKSESVAVSLNEIPFVRYRFNSFGEAEVAYIKSMQAKFKWSVHMVEVVVKPSALEELEILKKIDRLCIYVYVEANANSINNGFNPQEIYTLQLLGKFNSENPGVIDRFMLRDYIGSTLTAIDKDRLFKEMASYLKSPVRTFGVCNSPLSLACGACVPAEKARELGALYTVGEDVPCASANHENSDGCGCIKYMVIRHNIAAPEDKRGSGGNKKSVGDSSNGDSKSSGSGNKSSKAPKAFVRFK